MPDDQHEILKSCIKKGLLFQENAETSQKYFPGENDNDLNKTTLENIPFLGSAELQTSSL